jgi:hypothetical protein
MCQTLKIIALFERDILGSAYKVIFLKMGKMRYSANLRETLISAFQNNSHRLVQKSYIQPVDLCLHS